MDLRPTVGQGFTGSYAYVSTKEMTVSIEDDLPRPRAPHLSAQPLERLGIEELQAYIAGLQGEIGRAAAEIERKKQIRTAADTVFGKP